VRQSEKHKETKGKKQEADTDDVREVRSCRGVWHRFTVMTSISHGFFLEHGIIDTISA
jgi:hypothetical protein